MMWAIMKFFGEETLNNRNTECTQP
jgi:hypothetical protein